MGLLESLDSGVTGLVGQWNGYSTALTTLLVAVVTYGIMSSREPDVHPMLLARQSVGSLVRNEGESAIYRSQAAAHGTLCTGLNVKDPGVSKWSRGRDGDLRDIWRAAATGGEGGARGRILTVLGSERVVEHKLEDLTKQITIIGRHIADQGGIKVAIYLPNSVELLVALLACSFYPNLTTVLMPFDVSGDELISMLKRSAVDTLVTAAGAFPFDAVVKAYPSLRQLIWVVDEGSSHMDWNEVPEGTGGSMNVATWQDIVNESAPSAGAEVPALDVEHSPQDIVTFWQSQAGQAHEMVRFTQANMVAAVAGQISAIPTKERLCASDLFLAADSLAKTHTLVLTLAALYCNASVALNSVAGRCSDVVLATQGVAPTVVVARADMLVKAHAEAMGKLGSPLARLSHRLSTKALAQDGVLSAGNALSGFASQARPAVGTTPGKLRLVYVAERAGADDGAAAHLSSQVLSDLRVLTGARVVRALAAARVAGAVSQTAFFDYRIDGGRGHFGAPPACVELLMRDKGSHKTTDETVEGEITARGPCVSGGEAGLGVVGRMGVDGTLSLV